MRLHQRYRAIFIMESVILEALTKGVEMHKTGQLDMAKELYASVLQVEPRHPDANHNTGVIEIDAGNIAQAIPFLRIALEENSDNGQHWVSYIDALIRLNAIDDAQSMLAQARQKGAAGEAFDLLDQRIQENGGSVVEASTSMPHSSDVQDPTENQLQPLINLYSQGQLQQVLDEASKLLQQFPNSAYLFTICGAAHAGLGCLDDAVESYKKALYLKPNYAEAYNNMGLALQEQGKLEEAIDAYKKALAIEPNYAETNHNVGTALRDQGKLEEAIKAFNKALSLKPDYADAYNNMGNTLKDQGKLEQAIEVYNKALAIKPDYADVYYNMGLTLKDQGKLEEAIKAYNKLLAISPDYAEAYYNKGNALTEQGKLEEAVEAFTKALYIKPDYAMAKHMLSSLNGETTNTAPREYVENLFDGYADKFDQSLVEKLEYKIPKILTELAVKEHGSGVLGTVLDLGCGTGLTGVEIKQFCSTLEGIDLSKKMLSQARIKNVYDKLNHIDIIEYLKTSELKFDYFISTDVFIYLGDLSEVFRLIKSQNKKNSGKLVFSTEHSEKSGYHLEKSGRYSHSKSYIEGLCRKYDYSLSHFSETNLRQDKGVFLTGGLYLLDF